ncbi:hypothetical protein GJAV_G00225280 [Gymnothorax javanicus]|nr:hypothetical protein GJAV_G00225280 [Gymnothorax javanicus]
MSRQQDTLEKLDSDFDHDLVDMKPYVLKLPHKSERQRCALWIKKLCDPSASGSGLMARKNRNMYARLLLRMLRSGVLEGPFIHKPDAGRLKTLPTYMAIYFDEPLFGGSVEQSPAALPDWVSSELANGPETWASPSSERPTPVLTSTASPRMHRRSRTYGDPEPRTRASSSALTRSANEEDLSIHRRLVQTPSSDDSDVKARLSTWNLGIEKPRYLREKPIPLSPTCLKTSRGKNNSFSEDQTDFHSRVNEGELKVKVLEARFQEEQLKTQQRHDADVQKILERKNREIEELKAMYRTKQKDSEETIRKLEKKVQSLNEWEKKLHTAVTEMEQEKFDLQKKHTENIQELLEDTNERLAKMEAEYAAQPRAMEAMVQELEERVKLLSLEVENGNALRQKVTQEKAELEIYIASISSELQESNRRNAALLAEKEELVNSHEKTVQKMQAKQEADVSFLQQEHALSAAKASDVIVDLEQCVAHLRQQLQDCESKRARQLREQESKSSELLHAVEKKVRSLQNEVEKEKMDANKKVSKLEEALSQKEELLCRQRDSHRLQLQQAESALEQFKKQAEISTEKTFADMKQQMEKVEADLVRSKDLREKQAKEFSWQLEELKQRYEQQIVELKVEAEQERSQLLQKHNTEKDSLVREHRREIQSLEQQSASAMVQHRAETQEWRKRDSQTISQLEGQVHRLRDDLLQAHGQREQQLKELGLLRDEERQRAAHEQEAAVSRARAETQRLREELERAHTADRKQAVEKNVAKLKQVERDFTQKLSRASQTIAELQAGMLAAQQEAERQLRDSRSQWEEERLQLIRDSDRVCQAQQEKVETLQKQVLSLEKTVRSQEQFALQQVTRTRQEYEEKIKGLMPAALRRELEDTIDSLRSQVNFLQKRATALQETLDVSRSKSPFVSGNQWE